VTFQTKLEVPAVREIKNVYEWYEARRTGLGAEFLRAITAATQTLQRNPLQFQVTKAPFRWLKLRKYPYGLHYYIEGDTVLVVACRHFRQSPERWPGA